MMLLTLQSVQVSIQQRELRFRLSLYINMYHHYRHGLLASVGGTQEELLGSFGAYWVTRL